jgi:hypothetical protein
LICAFTPLLKPLVLIDLGFFVEKLYYILAEVYERRCKPNT